MLALLEETYTAQMTAALSPGELLYGWKSIIEGPYDEVGGIQAVQFPALEVLFLGGIPQIDPGVPGIVQWTGSHYIRGFVLSMADLKATKRALQRLLWSDNGLTGLVPFLAAHPGVDVNNTIWFIKPGRCSFRLGNGTTFGKQCSTYAVEIPLTVTNFWPGA